MLTVEINGEKQVFPQAMSLSELLAELGLKQKRLAVEVNLEIVPKSCHSQHQIADGDRIEIVQAIGGG